MNDRVAGNYLDVTIFGREYRVACAPGEESALQASVRLLDGRMNEVAGKLKSANSERVAVMTALNLAHELLARSSSAAVAGPAAQGFDKDAVKRRIAAMEAQLDLALQ